MELDFFYFLITLLITGTLSGLIAGLLGVGGGLVVIPVVFYILNYYEFSKDIIMHVAIASSLGVICITSLSSIYAHHKLKNIELMKKTVAAVKSFGAPISLLLEELDSSGMLDTTVENMGKIFISTELGGGGFVSPRTLKIAEKGIAGNQTQTS